MSQRITDKSQGRPPVKPVLADEKDLTRNKRRAAGSHARGGLVIPCVSLLCLRLDYGRLTHLVGSDTTALMSDGSWLEFRKPYSPLPSSLWQLWAPFSRGENSVI